MLVNAVPGIKKVDKNTCPVLLGNIWPNNYMNMYILKTIYSADNY